MDFLGDLGKKLSNAAKSVQERTKDSLEASRLSAELKGATNELEKLYGAVGRAYYDSRESGDDSALAPFVQKISEMISRIETLKGQRDKALQQRRCPSCGALQNNTARFCSGCGARLSEPEAPKADEGPALDAEYCPGCGAQRKDGATFCPVCGHGFGEAEEEKPEPEITWPGEKPNTDPAEETPTGEDNE